MTEREEFELQFPVPIGTSYNKHLDQYDTCDEHSELCNATYTHKYRTWQAAKESSRKELEAAKQRIAAEEEAHSQLQARCYDQGGTFSNVFDECAFLKAEKEALEKKLAEYQACLKPMYIFYMIEVERAGWFVGRKEGSLVFTNHAEEALTFYDKHSAEVIMNDYFGSAESYMHPTTYGKVSVTEHAWCNGPDEKQELTKQLAAARQQGFTSGNTKENFDGLY